MKLLRTSDMSVVVYCQSMFYMDLPIALLDGQMDKICVTIRASLARASRAKN